MLCDVLPVVFLFNNANIPLTDKDSALTVQDYTFYM